ncbi:MAG: hypothetical protein FWG14_11995 [Peptococcaceae bacterium]|nr:hypothetical protein [Peptococcaceae bacterium]
MDSQNALECAKGLASCLYNQDAKPAATTIEKLRQLSEDRFQDHSGIALEYAKGLVSLSKKAEVYKTMIHEKLQLLSEERFKDNAEIALKYADYLISLSRYEYGRKAESAVEKLQKLSEDQFKDHAEIAVKYAEGLAHLSGKQDKEPAAKTMEKLQQVSEDRFKDNTEIACKYAVRLQSLLFKQVYKKDWASATETFKKLEQLSEDRFKDNVEIALEYAQGLFTLSCDQNKTSAAATIEKLRQLSEERFSDNEKIAAIYTRRLEYKPTKSTDEYEKAVLNRLKILPENKITFVLRFFIDRQRKLVEGFDNEFKETLLEIFVDGLRYMEEYALGQMVQSELTEIKHSVEEKMPNSDDYVSEGEDDYTACAQNALIALLEGLQFCASGDFSNAESSIAIALETVDVVNYSRNENYNEEKVFKREYKIIAELIDLSEKKDINRKLFDRAAKSIEKKPIIT